MQKFSILIVLILPLLANCTQQCDYFFSKLKYQGTVIYDLRYPTPELAKEACNKDQNCKAIQYKDNQQYELLGEGKYTFNQGSIWIKQCIPNASRQIYGYSSSVGTFIPECFKNCIDFKTLKEAMYACNQESSCKGITYSYKEPSQDSKGAVDGTFGFQLRKGSTLESSNYGESSWLKI